MRLLLAASLLLATLAGCASPTVVCPGEYGAEYQQAYDAARAIFDEQKQKAADAGADVSGIPFPDADGDCVLDPFETELGTDPNDAASRPSRAQMESSGYLPSLNATQPPQPAYSWKSTPVSGDFTTTSNFAPAATGAFTTMTVPSGARRVFFNLTLTETSPLGTNVRFDPPSCTDSLGCNDSVASSGGRVSFEVMGDVEDGAWVVSFFAPVGAQRGSYEGEVNALVAAKAKA